MTELITLTIDDKTLQAAPGTTILEAARAHGIDIPTICVHEATKPNAVCRTCVVEVEGMRVLAASCVAQVSEGMVVHTRSERVERSRRTILEMMAASLDLSEAPEIQEMMTDYQVDPAKFPDAAKRNPPVLDDNPTYIRDYEKCILCWRCVQVCAEDAQYTYAINFSGRGFGTQISTFFDTPLPLSTCVFCGQCIGVCPTNALKPKREWLLEQGYSPEAIAMMTKTERRRRQKAQSGGSNDQS